MRIERHSRAARKAGSKARSQPPTSAPSPAAAGPSATGASLYANGAPAPPAPSISAVRSQLQPPKPPSVATDPATSPEQDLFPEMSFPAEWFGTESPQAAGRTRFGDELPLPLEGTIGGLNLDMDLNSFLGFVDAQGAQGGEQGPDSWGPWGEWAG